MRILPKSNRKSQGLRSTRRMPAGEEGMTLVEVLIALMLITVFATALISGFVNTSRANITSHYSFAANLLAMQRVEQVRAARWDAVRYPVLDEVVEANFPAQVARLETSDKNTTPIWATNLTSITTVSTNPFIKMIRVDCVYSVADRVVTNTVVSYRGTETGQQNAFAATVPLGSTPPLPPATGTATNTAPTNFREEGTDYDWDDDDGRDQNDDDDDDDGYRTRHRDRYGWDGWRRYRDSYRDRYRHDD